MKTALLQTENRTASDGQVNPVSFLFFLTFYAYLWTSWSKLVNRVAQTREQHYFGWWKWIAGQKLADFIERNELLLCWFFYCFYKGSFLTKEPQECTANIHTPHCKHTENKWNCHMRQYNLFSEKWGVLHTYTHRIASIYTSETATCDNTNCFLKKHEVMGCTTHIHTMHCKHTQKELEAHDARELLCKQIRPKY